MLEGYEEGLRATKCPEIKESKPVVIELGFRKEGIKDKIPSNSIKGDPFKGYYMDEKYSHLQTEIESIIRC